MSDEVVKKQVKGVCKEISEKSGWTTFHIDAGSQYPYKLATKLPELVQAGRGAGESEAVWTFSESQGGEIPNQPGKHYVNRRFEKVEIGAAIDPELDVRGGSGRSSGGGASGGGGGGGPRSEADRVSIERQSIIKTVIAALPEMVEKTPDAFFKLLDRIDDWMGRDRPIAPAAAPVEQAAFVSDDPPPPDQDDIPF